MVKDVTKESIVQCKLTIDLHTPDWQKYHANNHTSTHELGKIASRAKPKLLVLYHILFWGASAETVLKEVSEKYDGEVVLGNDLDVY